MFVGGGGLLEREEKVSMELTDEVLKSMEVGIAFRDYVNSIFLIFKKLVVWFDMKLLVFFTGFPYSKFCLFILNLPNETKSFFVVVVIILVLILFRGLQDSEDGSFLLETLPSQGNLVILFFWTCFPFNIVERK